MPTVVDVLEVQVTANTKQYEKGMTSTLQTAKRVGSNLNKFVTLPIVAVGAAFIKASADMESYQASFETLLGSTKLATGLLTDLKDIAAKTPFRFDDLATASKTMLSFGIELDNVLPNLKQLGDIAQGDREKLNSLTLAFSQIQSTGRLMGQDLLQLINAGFNPLQVISEKTGKSMAQLKDDMSKGAISAQMVSDAFKTATSEGGRFFGGMEKASQTLNGQFSTLMDNVVDLGRSFGEELLPIAKDVVVWATDLVKDFKELNPETKKLILVTAGVAAAAGPAATAITAVATSLGAMQIVLGGPLGVVALVAALAGGFKLLYERAQAGRIDEVAERFSQLGKELAETGKSAQEVADMITLIDQVVSSSAAMGFDALVDQIKIVSEEMGVTEEYAARIAYRSKAITDADKERLNQLYGINDLEVAIQQAKNWQLRLSEKQKEAEEAKNDALKNSLDTTKEQTEEEKKKAERAAYLAKWHADERVRIARISEYERVNAAVEAQQAIAASQEAQTAKHKEEAQKRKEAEKAVWDSIKSTTKTTLDETIQLLADGTDQQKEIAKGLFIVQKGINIGEAIMNGAVAATKALATLGPIAGPIAAGAMATLTAAQVAVIAAQAPPAQFGGSFTIPPGNQGDSGLVRVNQGERVDVTPARSSSNENKTMTLMIGAQQFRAYLKDEMNSIFNSGEIRITRQGVVRA